MKLAAERPGLVLRRYTFRLYPDAAQAVLLDQQRRMIAQLWNGLKQRCEDTYSRERRMLSYFDLTGEITGLRAELPEWRALPALTAHRVAKELSEAYQSFFRRVKAGEPRPGYPQWHAAERNTAIPLGTHGAGGWQMRQRREQPQSWQVHYKSISDVKRRETWLRARGRLPGEPATWRTGDLLWRRGCWWLSVCIALQPRRLPGRRPMHIDFDLLDCFARLNGKPVFLPELLRADLLGDRLDGLKSRRDARWPRGRPRDDAAQAEFADAAREIARLAGRIADIRKNALHIWTYRIVEQAAGLAIRAPRLRENTKSGKGNRQQWGANVAAIAEINRNTLNQASGAAIAMLVYKAAEAGISCTVTDDPAAPIAIVPSLRAAGQAARQLRTRARRKAA